jgi:hypothetical protein
MKAKPEDLVFSEDTRSYWPGVYLRTDDMSPLDEDFAPDVAPFAYINCGFEVDGPWTGYTGTALATPKTLHSRPFSTQLPRSGA